MNFYLYYIEGISVLDTPRFSNIESQENFFSSKLVSTVDNSFYPPHYENKIRFSTSIVKLTTPINYLSFKFMDKTYYYFIYNIKYINEDLLELSITMDTIQTYMFDIKFLNSKIDRLSINRWNGDNINREYIRENVSRGDKNLIKYEDLNPNNCYGILIKTSLPLSTLNSVNFSYTIDNTSSTSKVIPDLCYLYYLPIATFISNILIEPTIIYINEILSVLSKNDELVFSLDLIYNETFEKILGLSRIENDTVYMESPKGNADIVTINNSDIVGIEDIVGKYIIAINLIDYINTEIYKEIILNEYYKNSSIYNIRDKKYCPQLLDENYYEFEYGEKVNNTTFPLHKLSTNTILLVNAYDFVNNVRQYSITEDYDEKLSYIKDEYCTNILSNTQEKLTIYDNAWLSYRTLNTGTLTTGVSLARANALISTVKQSVGTIGKLASGNTVGAVTSGITGFVDAIQQQYNIDKNLQINRENLENTPNRISQGNSSNGDMVSRAISPYYRLLESEDIETVYNNLENYGYKVNVISNKNLFNDYNNRYYYNIIKTENLQLSLTILNDETTIKNIKDRFNNGIRLWNVENDNVNMCEYVYDNVENENLEEVEDSE